MKAKSMKSHHPTFVRTRPRRSCALLGGLGLLLWAAGGTAQSLEDAQSLLDSGDAAQVEEGIETLGLIGTAEALPPLQQRIRRGLPPALLQHAIITLTAIGDPGAGPTLLALANHRRLGIRAESLKALGSLRLRDAYPTLVRGLSDGDPQVRSAAAVALGQLGDATALPVLFQALDKGNLDASAPLGQLTPPGEVPRLLGYLEQLPFRSLAPAFTTVLLRKDINDPVRLDVIARIADLATREVRGYLMDLLAREPDRFSARVQGAIRAAIQGIPE